MQLDIFSPQLIPGVYRCTRAWTNEMGHTWKVGDTVHFLRYTSHGFPWCSTPENLPFGCGFELSEARLVLNFTRQQAPAPDPLGRCAAPPTAQ